MTTRKNIVAPNLTIAPKEYEQRYQEQLNNVQRLFYTTISNRVNMPFPYGSFITSGSSILNPVANVVRVVPFTVTTGAFNTTVGQQNTRIYVAETGVYNVQFSAQCDLSSGSNAAIYFWLRQNGTDVSASAGKVVVAGPNAQTMAAWNWVLTLQEGDYIELAWSSSDTHAQLLAENASTSSPVRPSVPAVILTICWVSPINKSIGVL